MKTKRRMAALLLLTVSAGCAAQTTLSLEDCRELAVKNNKALEQARTSVELAHYDRAIARAAFYPNISATGSYLYNSYELNLIGEEQSAALRNAGTLLQSSIAEKTGMLQQAILTSPALAKEYMQSPLWQTFLGTLSQTDISSAVNAIGGSIDELLHPDIHNIALAGVSLTQPVFVGGKILAANRIAALAEELAQNRYETKYRQTVVDVDQAYWQIVSIAAKKELATSYAGFLKTMEHDAEVLVGEGVYTASDQLAVKVKANEADMMLTQAEEGLRLAKMLLCQMTGLPIEADIRLSDEGTQRIPVPEKHVLKSMDEIIGSRPELKGLDRAVGIYEQKIRVARAGMMPQIALSANGFVTNPSLQNGYRKEFGVFWTAGVVVNVPVFHGLEALKKTQKAKVEAQLYRSKYEEAVHLVHLEVAQLKARREESVDRMKMAGSNLECAEENLRTAMLGFSEGVVESSVTLAAQAAWLKAHSEYIDAGIELQMIETCLKKAEGSI